MRSSYRLFRLAGISVELHVTFVALLLLLFLSPSFLVFFVTAFFFVLLHELSHCLVAKASGVGVSRITLTPIGGVASVEIPQKPWVELAMSVAGPLSNFTVVGVCLLLIRYFGFDFVGYMELLKAGELSLGAAYVLFTVLYVNLVLGLFNLVPGFPMDGGRILRSVLALFLDYVSATRIAVGLGRYVIFPLMFVVGFFSSNMMLVFIAVVLYLAGGQELKFTQLRRVFAGVRVCEVMAPKPVPVDSKTGLLSFMKDHENLLRRYHVVSDGGRVVGVFDILSVGSVGSGSFDALTVGDLASSDYGVVSAESDVGLELKTLLGRPFVLVVLENKVVGCVTPEVLVSRVPVFAVSKGLAF